MKAARNVSLAIVAATVAACGAGSPPCSTYISPSAEMPDLELMVGSTVRAVLADHFTHSECFAHLSDDFWEAQSADSAAVAVSVSSDILTIVAVDSADSVRVSIAWMDPRISHDFLVTVRPRS